MGLREIAAFCFYREILWSKEHSQELGKKNELNIG